MGRQSHGILGRTSRGLCLALGLAVIAGCAPIEDHHGYAPTDEQLSEIVVGKDTRESVTTAIGTPSSSGMLKESGYYYVSQQIDTFAFRAPKVVEREVVAISFDQNGVVTNVERFGLQDGNIVALSRRVTSTNVACHRGEDRARQLPCGAEIVGADRGMAARFRIEKDLPATVARAEPGDLFETHRIGDEDAVGILRLEIPDRLDLLGAVVTGDMDQRELLVGARQRLEGLRHLAEEGVAQGGDHQPEDVAAPRPQIAGMKVRLIVHLPRPGEDQVPRLVGDAEIRRAPVQHQTDRRAGKAGGPGDAADRGRLGARGTGFPLRHWHVTFSRTPRGWTIPAARRPALHQLAGVTPFFRMMLPYFAVSPVCTTAKAFFVRS